MAAGGADLFDDDTACDVRDAYKDALEELGDDDAATAAVIEEFAEALEDQDEAPIVWLALAYTQSKLGRLSSQMRQTALAILDAGADIARWEEESGTSAVHERQIALDKIREQIEGLQPKPKRIRKPARQVSSLQIGQVLAYHAKSGRVYLMRVANVVDNAYYRAPKIRFLEYVGQDVPSRQMLEKMFDREQTPAWRIVEQVVIEGGRDEASDYGVEVVGSIARRSEDDAVTGMEAVSGWMAVVNYLESRDKELGPHLKR